MIPDLINGLFELMGAVFIGLSCKKLYKEKIVRGVSWLHVGYFASWGFWNLFFYPHVGAWLSFAGGVAIVIANVVWLVMIYYYNYRERNSQLPELKVVKPS